MAQMFPESLGDGGEACGHVPTDGERIVFDVFRDGVKPDLDSPYPSATDR